MWIHRETSYRGTFKFFRITLSDEGLVAYYKINFGLHTNHGLPINTIENMLPFERDIYIALVIDKIEKEEASANNK